MKWFNELWHWGCALGLSKNRLFMLFYKGFKFSILVIERSKNNSRITLILFFSRKVFHRSLRYGHRNFQCGVFHVKELVSDGDLLKMARFIYYGHVQLLLILQILLRLLKKFLQGFHLQAKLLDGVLHAFQSCRIVELWLYILFHFYLIVL